MDWIDNRWLIVLEPSGDCDSGASTLAGLIEDSRRLHRIGHQVVALRRGDWRMEGTELDEVLGPRPADTFKAFRVSSDER